MLFWVLVIVGRGGKQPGGWGCWSVGWGGSDTVQYNEQKNTNAETNTDTIDRKFRNIGVQYFGLIIHACSSQF